jgi:NAD(P)-dependent dehydrogenase (short-subunit alcohol dehydrogenase family)
MRWVITGANRGIGLEFARQLAQRGEMVEAGVRDLAPRGPIAELALGSNVNIHPCDVGSDEGVAAFARSIGDVPVDVLINNAGVMGKMQAFEDLDLDDVMQTINVNAIGVIRVTRALMPNMLKGTARRIVHISSGMGSIADNGSGGHGWPRRPHPRRRLGPHDAPSHRYALAGQHGRVRGLQGWRVPVLRFRWRRRECVVWIRPSIIVRTSQSPRRASGAPCCREHHSSGSSDSTSRLLALVTHG